MNKSMKYKIFTALAALLFVGACTEIAPVPLNVNTHESDSEALSQYKDNIFSRPVVMGMIYDWQVTNGVALSATPDSLDVLVVKGHEGELTEAQAVDLKQLKDKKSTTVLLGCDLDGIDVSMHKVLKKAIKTDRKALTSSWTEENTPDPDEQERLIAELETKLTTEYAAKAKKAAEALLSQALSTMSNAGFDGISLKLPEDFLVLSQDETTALLAKTTAATGGTQAPFLAVETPYEAGRSEIQKATWVIGNRRAIEHKMAAIAQEAALWPDVRYIPSVDISDGANVKGFSDSRIFSPKSPIHMAQEIITWSSVNKAGVAFYHIESNLEYNDKGQSRYPYLKELINQTYLTK